MNDLSQTTVNHFLDQLAARTPSPGGGAVAAAVGALSAAMGRMVLAYSIRELVKPGLTEAAAKLRSTDELLRALISQDAEAYERMTAATKAAKNDPARRADAQQAVLAAIAVPLQMAALAAQTLAALDAVKADTNRYLVSDLGVAAVTGLAAAEAAGYSVRINAPQLEDAATRQRVLRDLEQTLTHVRESAERIRRFVDERMA